MVEVYVSVGSNICRQENIRSGVQALKQEFTDLQCSSVYESAAAGFEGDPFYNLVVMFQGQDLEYINGRLRDIEHRHGRVRQAQKFCSRTLDLDLLLFGDRVLTEQGWDIPRAEITRYAFILWPLAEIAPKLMHPSMHLTMSQLWQEYLEKHPNTLKQIQTVSLDFL